MAKKIGEVELKALVAREISLAKSDRAELSKKQTKALEYYQGEMKDVPAETGRSSAVSRDLADVMGWVLPGIMRVYTASEHMAVAEPVGAEDMEGAKQATDGLNYVFWKDNDGYRIVYNATWDSLIGGNGVVKTWHDDAPKETVTFHSGIGDDEFTLLVSDDGVGVVEHTPSTPMVDDGAGGFVPDPSRTHKVKIKRTVDYGCTKVEAIPPEDYGIDSNAKTCDDARFQYHRSEKTRSDLIEMGFDRKKVEALGRSADSEEQEKLARDSKDTAEDGDQSMEICDLYECYVRVDINGDGIAELCRVMYAGNKDGGDVLDWEEWEDETPFDDIPCSPMPHKWEAGSLADETMDVQRIKTVLQRQALDNTYATNNPQRFVTGEITNPDELFSPSFGGAIFGKTGSTVTPLTIPFVANHAYDAINYQDQVIERRTGVSKTTMALDPDALQNQTATANQNAKDAAYSQIELIARNQAELGWKKVFRKILKLEIKHQNKPRHIRMRGKFVEIDPRSWNADMDISINVGLGTGSRDRDMAMLNQVKMDQFVLTEKLALVSPAKALEMLPYIMTTLNKSAEAAGIRSPELFFPEVTQEDIDAGKQLLEQRAQQPDPAIMLEKAKGETAKEIEAFKVQAETQTQQMQMQREIEKERAQMQADLEVKMAEMQAKMAQDAQNLDFEREKLMAEDAQKEKDREQQWNIELLKINAQAQAKQQEIGAQREMHGEKLAHDERTKKSDARNKQNDALIATGKNPIPEGVEPEQMLKGMADLVDKFTMVMSAPIEMTVDPTTGRKRAQRVMQ